MINLIGLPLDRAIKIVKDCGLKVVVIGNNYCVKEEVKLVTNAKTQGDEVVLTVGEFIFDLKE